MSQPTQTAAHKTALLEILKIRNEKFLDSRLVGLGLYDACTRCGGSGAYSYCQMYGTKCFRCGGSGKQSRKIDAKLVAEAREIAASGKLDAYLAELTRANVARKAAQTASDRMFAAWKANPTKLAQHGYSLDEQSLRVSAINCFCSNLYNAVSSDLNDIRFGKYNPATRSNVPLSLARVESILARVDAVVGLMTHAEEILLASLPAEDLTTSRRGYDFADHSEANRAEFDRRTKAAEALAASYIREFSPLPE